MGVASRIRDIRPPLPAPTESMDEGEGTTSAYETDVATNVTTRTDKTSYEVPADGSPITIPTNRVTSGGDIKVSKHGRHKSQTSLLIEYFEGSKTGDKTKSKPSVRVKVTPSSRKRTTSGGHEAIQITGIDKDRKPSYTRRISLGGSSKNAEVLRVPPGIEGTEISQSSGSGNPLEIEVLNSDVSTQSRGLMYAQNESNVSSMPPDSMLEGSHLTESELGPARDYDDDELTVKKEDYLEAPEGSRNRSASQDRITQKVMEKLGQTSSKPYKSGRSRSDRSLSKEYDHDGYPTERRRRSSKSHTYEEDSFSGAASQLEPSQVSYRSGSDVSKSSRVTNNPKLLEMVEDTVKRIILPEINQIKRDQSLRSSEHSRRGSYDDYSGLGRRVSKSSSSPNISSKPKVVLNKDGDDPGTVLSRGDSERKHRKSSREHRPSSRRSSGSRRTSYDYDDETTMREKSSSKSNHKIRDAAAAGIAGGILTAGALKMHDSQGDGKGRDRERRKKRSSKSHGSGSRSASVAETTEDTYTLRPKEDIPPMPMASGINNSEMTRESILSVDTDAPSSHHPRTPIREVSRGSLGTPSSRTPTRTPVGSRSLGMSQSNRSIDSPKSPGGRSTKDRMAALAAAGVAGAGVGVIGKEAYDRTVDADGYGDSSPSTQRKISSPVQSVSSLKNRFEESLGPSDSRPQSAASRSSAGRLREKSSARSGLSSPTSKLARSRQQSQNISGDEYATPMERPDAAFTRESTPGTPAGETVDDWYERQHRLNDRYRDSLDEDDIENRDSFAATNRDSYQTNPYPQDEKRFTQFTDDSLGVDSQDGMNAEQDVRALGANPKLMHNSFGAESNVASLMEPSFVSSDVRSSQASGAGASGSPTKGSFAARLREMGKDSPSGLYNGSTMSQSMPSQDRWAALSSRAKEMSLSSQSDAKSPRQSPAKSLREQESTEGPLMGASGLPIADDPIPEIGHYDDTKSEISTNPSIIQGPLGGDATGKDTWPYTPEPEQKELQNKLSRSVKSDDGRNNGLKAAAAGAGAAALVAGGAYAATHRKGSKQPMVEDEEDMQRELTPDLGRSREYIDREATPTSPAAFRDEGYVTENTRSGGALTPRAERQYSRKDMDEYNRAMDAQDLGDEDPFVGSTHQTDRVVSGNSHGMGSPLYDASTGKGVENIQSKDIVALMDHLTVRDAQRNARDTEILVSLVRSAAEMRNSFDEMKKFIVEQDRMIMSDAQRGHNQIKSAVMSGPRAMPSPSNRTPRQSDEDIQTKRKGVLRRALKGLTGSKSAKDLDRVEDMLMQILENVEDLKVQQGGMTSSGGDSRGFGGDGFGRTGSLDSYERLRNRADESGYEPEGQAGTSSTPSQSGFLATTPRAEKQQFHSGYDGRRGSENRVSTVLEGDEEELEPHETRVLDNQFENNEGFGTPTQQRSRRYSPSDTPYGAAEIQPDEITPRSADKQRKHKSNNSSIFGGIPKISRWSKTTSSSAAPDPATIESPVVARGQRPGSQASSLREYDDDGYSMRSNGQQRSMQSLNQQQADMERRSMRSQASRLTRTPSPLIPSEASMKQRDEYDNQSYDDRAASPVQEDEYMDELSFDDPKYQAYRNSLPLQHPQPRKGDTDRHQNNLESQAHIYAHEDVSATDSNLSQRTVSDDVAMFGSSGTAALSKHRFSQMSEPMSPISMNSPRGARDVAPLIPSKQNAPPIPPKVRYDEPDPEDDDDDDYYGDREPQYSNSGFSRGGYYSSPFGSGHLLEPIEEVRYSLETDSGHSPEPEAQPQVAKAVDVGRGAGGARKITGPRPMNLSGAGGSGVRRKPVGSADDGAY